MHLRHPIMKNKQIGNYIVIQSMMLGKYNTRMNFDEGHARGKINQIGSNHNHMDEETWRSALSSYFGPTYGRTSNLACANFWAD